jgi:ATP-dependent Clp protease, protease subunit
MNFGKEFKKFATKHHGVNSLYYDKIVAKYDSLILLKNVN